MCLNCRCIPDPEENKNQIPGNRAERSHETSMPNWEIMTMCGLLTGLLILVVVVISLSRNNRRLRQRLITTWSVVVVVVVRWPLCSENAVQLKMKSKFIRSREKDKKTIKCDKRNCWISNHNFFYEMLYINVKLTENK